MPYYVRYLCLLRRLSLAGCRKNACPAKAREVTDTIWYLRHYAAVANSTELITSGIRTGAGH